MLRTTSRHKCYFTVILSLTFLTICGFVLVCLKIIIILVIIIIIR